MIKRELKREAGPKHPAAMCVSGERKIMHKRVFPVGREWTEEKKKTEVCQRTPGRAVCSVSSNSKFVTVAMLRSDRGSACCVIRTSRCVILTFSKYAMPRFVLPSCFTSVSNQAVLCVLCVVDLFGWWSKTWDYDTTQTTHHLTVTACDTVTQCRSAEHVHAASHDASLWYHDAVFTMMLKASNHRWEGEWKTNVESQIGTLLSTTHRTHRTHRTL